jgi:ABC-2 type transport system permease protein
VRGDLVRARALIRRDLDIALSLKIPFLFEFVGTVFVVVEFYYLSRIVPETAQTGDYLGFVTTGLVVTTLLISGAATMAGNVRQEQVQGTLEVTLSSGVPPIAFMLGTAGYPLAAGAVRAILYAFVAYLVGARVPGANWGVAVAALVAGTLAFVGVGLVAVSLVIVVRQAAGAIGWLLGAVTLLAGVMFPIDLLPTWLRFLAGLSAATWTLRIVREAVLEGAGWDSTWPGIVVLVVMAVVYGVVAVSVLRLALRRARRTGVLAQY